MNRNMNRIELSMHLTNQAQTDLVPVKACCNGDPAFRTKHTEKTWKTYKMIRQRMMTCAVSWMLFSTLTSEHVKLRSPAPVLLMSTMPGICSISMQLYWHKRGLSYQTNLGMFPSISRYTNREKARETALAWQHLNNDPWIHSKLWPSYRIDLNWISFCWNMLKL